MNKAREVIANNGINLRFFGNKIHTGHDFLIHANTINQVVEYLVFLDSRGISKGFDDSLVKSILACIGEKKYIAVCRPLNMTTWATLFNFLSINRICPKSIITNMGLVDFIPKKKSVLDEVTAQIEHLIGTGVSRLKYQQDYQLSSGQYEALYSMTYSAEYLQCVQEIADQHHLIVLNTPTVKSDISIQRERPAAFFSGIEQSNRFNKQISGAMILEFGVFNIEQTYDAIHYTTEGNRLIMNQLEAYL